LTASTTTNPSSAVAEIRFPAQLRFFDLCLLIFHAGGRGSVFTFMKYFSRREVGG
jgi:hypothetical protein